MEQPSLSFDLTDRVVYAHDASLYRMVPRAVARPQNERDVLELVHWATENRSSLTFRTGGTSLSGQAVTNETLVLLGKEWNSFEVLNDGLSFCCGPAIRGGIANRKLARYQRRIGPDPASISAACLGGIVANNASGMCCGIEENSYQTLIGLRLILSNGCTFETHRPESDEQLKRQAPEIYFGLMNLRDKVRSSPQLSQLIRRKSSIKNTMGYALNSFLEFERASDILARLMVGSEGTLGFISQIVMQSVPLRPHRATSLMLFKHIEDACALASELKQSGCSAVEFLDYQSVCAISNRQGVPDFLLEMKRDSAVLLTQIQSDSMAGLSEALELNRKYDTHKTVTRSTGFFADELQQEQLWNLRKGIFPTVGARRPKGDSVIIEDVAFHLKDLPKGTVHLRQLLDRHGYQDAVIYGHARDGNLHFVLSQNFANAGEVSRYAHFIEDMASSVATEFGGSLKAEHGTGRNMAPFVELEWGREAYEVMLEVKRLLDPHNIFNAGVMINRNTEIHLQNLKTIPATDEIIDSCIECGFCEPVCPSEGLTLSPRGRIVLEREKNLDFSALLKSAQSELSYQQLDTCAADGLCATACPVGINTGLWVKEKRSQSLSVAEKALARFASDEMKSVEAMARVALAGAAYVSRAFGAGKLQSLTRAANRFAGTPAWSTGLNGAPLQDNSRQSFAADYILFRSCVTRTCGTTRSFETMDAGDNSIQMCAQRAGKTIAFVSESGLCCGQPWDSKGFSQQSEAKLRALADALYERSCGGKIPVVIDNSPCTYALIEFLNQGQALQATPRLVVWDLVDFALHLTEFLDIKPLSEPTRFFPVCALRKMGKVKSFEQLAGKIAQTPVFPDQEACCGMAGDRGLWFPELVENASRRHQWRECGARQGYCSSRTCEIAVSSESVRFSSIFNALELASRP